MRWVIRHPVSVASLLVSLTILFASQLPGLKVYISPQALSIADSPAQQQHQESIETFGSDSVIILYVRDDDLFAPQRIEALRSAVKRIQALNCVSHTRSLFDVPHLREVDEFIHNQPFLEKTPATPAEAGALVQAALASPFVRNNLLSDDGRVMAINIYIRPRVDELRFDERVTHSLDAVTRDLEPLFDEVFHVGAPEVRRAISETIWDEMLTIGPLSVGLLFLTLALVLRQFSGVLIPLLTATLSVVWTLGLMAAVGLSINVMTAIVPILLIVIGSTEDIHLISEYYSGIGRGYSRRRAVQHMIRRMGLAITLTFVTSFLGFLALGFNPIQLVREFVLVATTGLAISFLVTVLTVPLLLRYLGETRLLKLRQSTKGHSRHSLRIAGFALAHRRGVLVGSALFIALSVYFASGIRVNNNIMDYLDEETLVSQQISRVQQDLSGLETFNIVVDGHVEGTFQRVRYLEELEKLQDYLRDTGQFDFTLSFVDYVKVINSLLDEDNLYALPEEDDVVETLALFVSSDKTRPYITADYSQANILVRHSLSSSAALNQELQKLQQFVAAEVDPALQVTVTGHSILSNQASDQLAASQGESLLFMLLVIFGVIALLFLNARAGLLAVMPNIFLVAGLFGAMGLLGIPLDTGSTMIAAIALGVSVDHTMHLLVRYYSLTRARVEPRAAVQQAAAIEFRPIMAASLALAAGFLVMGLSDFTPVVHFGLLSALVMLLAVYANFVITPVLISFVRLTTLWDLLSMPTRQGLRQHCSLFQGMNELQVRQVLSFGTIRDFPAGSHVFEQGWDGSELYILLAGEVRVCQGSRWGRRVVTDKTPGERVFGTASLIRGLNHKCSAEVMRDAQILVLDWERLEQLQKFRPRTGSRLYRNLSIIMARLAVDREPPSLPLVDLRDVS
jgi:predicted RND superfamily exporter protein